jgi:hypothetical protein
MNFVRRYIPESWKNFSAYATLTVISPTELFRRYFIEGWNKITLNVIANHQKNYSVGIF